MDLIVIVSLAVAVLIVLIGLILYNSLVGKKNQVENAFSSIDVYLKKRYDLIPNLVAAVQQYMKHEADTLTKVTEMRARATSGSVGTDEKIALNNQLSAGLGRIMVAVEAYPELKANENFNQLQRTLNEIEEQLSAARRAFNASITDLNNAVEMFPTNILAGMMGYTRRTLLVTPETERTNVNVSELFNR